MSGTHTSSIFFKVLGALSVNYYLIYTWCRRLRVGVPAVLVGGLFSAWAAGGLVWWRSVSPGSGVVGARSLSLGGAGLVRVPLGGGLTTSSAVRRMARRAAAGVAGWQWPDASGARVGWGGVPSRGSAGCLALGDAYPAVEASVLHSVVDCASKSASSGSEAVS